MYYGLGVFKSQRPVINNDGIMGELCQIAESGNIIKHDKRLSFLNTVTTKDSLPVNFKLFEKRLVNYEFSIFSYHTWSIPTTKI